MSRDARTLLCADGPCRGQEVATTEPDGAVVEVTQYVQQDGPDVWGWQPYDRVDYRVCGGELVEVGGPLDPVAPALRYVRACRGSDAQGVAVGHARAMGHTTHEITQTLRSA